MEAMSTPGKTVKLAMCMSPWTSMIAIGSGYTGGRIFGSDPLSAALYGAAGAAVISGIVEMSPSSVGGHWDSPWEAKRINMASMAVVGAAAGAAGNIMTMTERIVA